MENVPFFVGIDIACDDFTAAIVDQPGHVIDTREKVPNRSDGFHDLDTWLGQQGVTMETCVICMENTGVYNEALCYYLAAVGYHVAVVPPHHAKKRFTTLSKTDRIDSKQLAEYACRYYDQLRFWKPREPVLEQIKVLYTTREHFTRQLIANKNALTALERKVVKTPLASSSYRDMITEITRRIKALDEEIAKLINANPTYKQLSDLADSVPGVGQPLANSLMVITDGFTNNKDHKKLCSLLGLAPHEHQSGKSILYRPRSVGHGNPRIRKLLHLAARSVATHIAEFRHYYLRKLAEGKPKLLIYNNIANKLIKIVLAVVQSRTPYIKGYRSVNPTYLGSKTLSLCH